MKLLNGLVFIFLWISANPHVSGKKAKPKQIITDNTYRNLQSIERNYKYVDNPVQIFAICCGGHFVNFPMFLFSLAKTYNFTSNIILNSNATPTSYTENFEQPLPFNLTFMMDEMCYQQINGGQNGICIDKLQSIIPFNVIHHKNYFVKEYEKYHSSRFHCTPYKMDIVRIADFLHLNYLLVLDIDCLIYNKIDRMWSEITSSKSGSDITLPSNNVVKNEKTVFWAALEVSNISASGLKTFPNAKNLWYIQRNKTHYYPPTGLNTGVMLYNLHLMRMRNITIYEFVKDNTEDVQLADQDYLNSWAFYHPDAIGLLNCSYNTRKDINCIDHEVDEQTGQIKSEFDLFHAYDKTHILHANNGYTRRGPGKALSYPFREMLHQVCGFWTPL